MEDAIVKVDIATMASLLFDANNRFIRVTWESEQKELRKKGNPYRDRLITKIYVATCRNNYSFTNRVRNTLARRGTPQPEYQCGPRSWGEHIPHTPFVVHQINGDLLRLHLHLLPVRYYHFDDTGYYVDGEKVDDAELRPFEKVRRVPDNPLDKARRDSHPVNARLDDVHEIRISGVRYDLKIPKRKDIEKLAAVAIEFGQKLAGERAA